MYFEVFQNEVSLLLPPFPPSLPYLPPFPNYLPPSLPPFLPFPPLSLFRSLLPYLSALTFPIYHAPFRFLFPSLTLQHFLPLNHDAQVQLNAVWLATSPTSGSSEHSCLMVETSHFAWQGSAFENSSGIICATKPLHWFLDKLDEILLRTWSWKQLVSMWSLELNYACTPSKQ